MLVAVVAWLLHVAAMALAPLSLVQAVISGGLVFLTVLAERFFGFKVGRRQWIGVGLTALGLALLAVTLPAHRRRALELLARRHDRLRGRPARPSAPCSSSRPSSAPRTSTTASCSASPPGILFGVSDVAIKALTGASATPACSGLALALARSPASPPRCIAFFASARGLQKGEAVPVITITSAAANVSAIAGGILVFGDPLPGDTLGIVVQMFAFVLVIAAAALTPGAAARGAPGA